MGTSHPALALLTAALLALSIAACEQAGEEGEEAGPADTAAMEEAPPAEVEMGAGELSYQLVITNPMPHAMNVTATLADGSQVQLGTVAASGESTFTITGEGGEAVTVTATDEANTHSPSGTVTLPVGETTVSWTIQ